jgi:hypothetical protein
MNHTEREVAEVDQLVRNLTSGSAPGAGKPQGVEQPRPPSRWSNITMRMPARTEPGVVSRAAHTVTTEFEGVLDDLEAWFWQAVAYVRGLRRFVRVPSTIALVRVWVALASACAIAMSFWPYPKTYFWGLVLYQLCLGLALVAGIWGARLSWDARLGAAHTLALGTVLWAVTLGTADTITLLRGTNWHEAPTFASARFAPAPRPAPSIKLPAKTNRAKSSASPT